MPTIITGSIADDKEENSPDFITFKPLKYEITDRIMNNTFWIGVYPGMTDVMLNKMIKTIEENV